jgi:sec-independent protein translocase protein TatA
VGTFSLWHWIIVAVAVLVLFGRGKISETMGDFGKGIQSFKKGMADGEEPEKPSSIAAAQLSPLLGGDRVTSKSYPVPQRRLIPTLRRGRARSPLLVYTAPLPAALTRTQPCSGSPDL